MTSQRELAYRADGLDMRSTLHLPSTGRADRGVVLAFPEAPGLGSYVQGRAAQLAGLGYMALACDLHGDATVLTDPDTIRSRVMGLLAEPARMRARARGALDAVTAALACEPARIAAIGYCFGGAMALELGRSGAGLAGIVGFHCTLTTQSPAESNRLDSPVLICTGAEDPMIDADQRLGFETELKSCDIDWQMHVYGWARHGFTNPAIDQLGIPALRYDAIADERSWRAMRGFFDEIFANDEQSLPASAFETRRR